MYLKRTSARWRTVWDPKIPTFEVAIAMKLYRPQLSALAILLCFVTSSVVGSIMSPESDGPEIWKFALHSPGDMPHGNNQLPFEEKEKELEDKSDADSNQDNAVDNHVLICDFRHAFLLSEQIPQTNSLFDRSPLEPSLFSQPIFILDGSLLI